MSGRGAARSVGELEAVLPGLVRWRVPGGRRVDWDALAAALGAGLPADFRALAEAYPGLVLGEFLTVSLPRPGGEAGWGAEGRDDEILQDLYETDDTDGYVPYPRPGGLIAWAESTSGDVLYWHTERADPDAWTVVLRTANAEWSEYGLGAVAFLTAVYGGTLALGGMPRGFPGEDVAVLGLPD